MIITAKDLRGGSIQVACSPFQTVGELKLLISQANPFGPCPEIMHLIHAGRLMSDE
jgi:hypothetical protein